MSYEEKSAWVYATVSVLTYVTYLAVLVTRADGSPVVEVAYRSPLVCAMAVSIMSNIVIRIVIAVARPHESRLRDQRDQEINRYGNSVGGIVLAVAMAVPFALTFTQAAPFWIANAMYTAFTLWAVATSAGKLVAYRRGL